MNRWTVIVMGALTLAACSEPGVAPGDQDGPVPGYGTVGSHVDLGLQPPVARAPSHGGRSAEAVVNGGFEENGGPGSTTFTGWGTYNSGNGAVLAQTGTISPLSGLPVPAPAGGEYAAMVDQSGPGTHILYQDVVVPKNAQLEFDLFLSNRSEEFHSPDDLSEAVFPNQQFRMDVMDPSAPVDGVLPNEVLATAYRTLPGDPLESGYERITFDMSAFKGKSVRLRFAEVDNQGNFQVGIDNVTLGRGTPGGSVSTVGICHRSEGARGYIKIIVGSPAVPAHLQHGDGMPGEPVPGEPGMVFDGDCVPSTAPADFYLATNGITIMCPAAQVGDVGMVNGVQYTKRDEAGIRALVEAGDFAPLETTCTSDVVDMSAMFYGTLFNHSIGHWDVSSVTDMYRMFGRASEFNQPIGDWDVSSVTDMSSMFLRAFEFNQPIGDWDVSSVTDMYRMFAQALEFNQPIGDWDVSNVTNMDQMLYVAAAFNQPIGDWDVSSVTDMSWMFLGARSFNQPIGDWDVSSVTSMWSMFSGAHEFNQPVGDWDVSSVTSMWSMFSGAREFNQPVGDWDVSSVINMSSMFSQAYEFNQPIGDWDVSGVTDMSSMFFRAESFNQNLSGWCVANIPGPPVDFDTGATAWGLPRPIWGTCPSSG